MTHRNKRLAETDLPIDTQEVTDSSSVKPTTNPFVSIAGPAGFPAADRLIHRKPIRIGSHVVTETCA